MSASLAGVSASSTLFSLLLNTRAGRMQLSGAAPSAALLFDCDNVLVDAEEMDRVAYNQAFSAFGLEMDGRPIEWPLEYFAALQNTVGGGKPQMRYHFLETCGGQWPAVTQTVVGYDSVVRQQIRGEAAGMALIEELHSYQKKCYDRLVPLAVPRPGILELMDEAIATRGLAVGVCSAQPRSRSVTMLEAVLGKERAAKLDALITGDEVNNMKPDPEIYHVAASRLGVECGDCVVIEDSMVGLRAAKAAGMRCIVTYPASAAEVDFYRMGADAKLLDFRSGVRVRDVFTSGPMVRRDSILYRQRDPKPLTPLPTVPQPEKMTP
jgi:HAD superfamily hydrolase (TIGR01509 family)